MQTPGRRVEPQTSMLPLERRMDSLERRFINFSNAQQLDEETSTSIRGLGRIVLEMEQMQNNMEAMQREIRRDLRERAKYFKEEQKLLKKDLKNTEDFKTAALFDLRKIIGLFGFAVAANELSQGDIGGAIQGVGLGIGSFLPEITTAVVGILAAKGLIGGGMMGGGMVAGGGRRLLGGGMVAGGGRMAGGLGLLGGKGKGILALAALGGLLLTGGALAGGGNTSRMQVGDKKIDDGNDVLNRSDTVRFRRQLSRFGAILDDIGKESTTAAKSDKGIGQVNEKFEKDLKDISKSSPDKIKKFKSTEVELPDEVEPQEFNKGGKVPGSGNTDTVPAMLTPGEVVMSKPAVDKIGADKLLAMNAAGGGTNRPSYDTLGYRFNQVNPPTLVTGSKRWTETTTDSHSTKKGGILSKIFDRDFESFKEKNLGRGLPGLSMQTIEKYKEGNLRGKSVLTEDIASVGVPDIMEHQEDLMKRINAVKGFEDKTIDDVIGGTVGMDTQQYTRLLNRSDAARATEKKREEARKLDEKENIDTSYRTLPAFQGGGLVLGKTPMQQVREFRDERREILRNQVDGKMNKEQRKRYKYLTHKLNQLSDEMKADKKVTNISPPTAPIVPDIVPETKNIKPIETKEVPSSMIAQPIITNIPGKTTNMPPPAPSGDEFGSEKFVSINTRFQGSIDKLDSAYTLNSYAALQ